MDDGVPPSIVHPIYAHMPDAAQNDRARADLTSAAGHYHLKPVEIVDIEGPPPPTTPASLKEGMRLVQKLAFDDALKVLDTAATEAAATGGAGLSTEELSDLYFNRGMAIAKADWKPQRSVDEATRARAFQDYVRAAMLTPGRELNTRDTPPQVLEDWPKAVAEIKSRPRGSLVVRAGPAALVTIDGGTPVPGSAEGAAFKDLPYGEHFLHIDEAGRAPWGTVLTVNEPAANVSVPARAALTLDDSVAASHAKRMGAKFALVTELRLGEGDPQVELRLVDTTGVRHDATRVALGAEAGSLDAAVMRLDEEARRIERMGLAPGGAPPAPVAPPLLATPAPPPRASFRDDPAAWARDHWPLVTAVGVMVGAALVLSLTVALDN